MKHKNVITDGTICPASVRGYGWESKCARCGSSAPTDDCEHCGGEGVTGHDCGEDCCCCAAPEDKVVRGICWGRGFFESCCSSADYCEAHPMPGRENTPRGHIEYFVYGLCDEVEA